jgi:hypothetical protein
MRWITIVPILFGITVIFVLCLSFGTRTKKPPIHKPVFPTRLTPDQVKNLNEGDTLLYIIGCLDEYTEAVVNVIQPLTCDRAYVFIESFRKRGDRSLLKAGQKIYAYVGNLYFPEEKETKNE